jgi:hypothetical protein
MNTRRKNKSAHPRVPDMTPSQLLSASLSRTPNTRRPSSKKLTKDQQIAALKDELRATQELISGVSPLTSAHTYCGALIASLSRATLTSVRYTTRWKHRWTRVVTRTLRLIPKRPMSLWVQSARLWDWRARQQGGFKAISISVAY